MAALPDLAAEVLALRLRPAQVSLGIQGIKSGGAEVGCAVDQDLFLPDLLHDAFEAVEVLPGRILPIDGDVVVLHAERLDSPGFIGQGITGVVGGEVDDDLDAGFCSGGELVFAGLTSGEGVVVDFKEVIGVFDGHNGSD